MKEKIKNCQRKIFSISQTHNIQPSVARSWERNKQPALFKDFKADLHHSLWCCACSTTPQTMYHQSFALFQELFVGLQNKTYPKVQIMNKLGNTNSTQLSPMQKERKQGVQKEREKQRKSKERKQEKRSQGKKGKKKR